jgi:RNA polymerase sigma-70 factor (ECF subfamily)
MVSTTKADDVTRLLARWKSGSHEAEGQLMVAVHRELRRLAGSYLRRERSGHTLQPTALVNEAYLRLIGQHRVQWQSRGHFFGVAAQMMRRILVDHARRRRAGKRAVGDGEPLSLSGVPDPAGGENVDVLSLHEALTDLAALDARQAQIVELRYFGGLTIDEIAASQTISPATVKRELTTAKLWLGHRMQRRPLEGRQR